MDPQARRAGTEQTRGAADSAVPANLISALVGICAIGFMILVPLSANLSSIDIIHQVPEGHVGVYWRGGALLKSITGPGFHLKMPFLTHYEPIQVTIQTDQVLIAVEKQKVVEKEVETQKKMAVTEAEKDAQVSRILMEQRLKEKESLKRQEEIENEMYLAREKNLADSNYYKVLKEAEANKLKLTPEYLELRFIEAIANNTKLFFGDKVPSMVFDQRLLGSILAGLTKPIKSE
eukprot:TRINITY_DN3874_c0_g1_i1.p1 TRINITY_DN3874_c0_g1~~TRINITY_DN3874_c0_g1_i1.p1  ORF type:complete len:234 (-),score=43.03 TRINITY_DN3874_c0_g1_i1:327-1028(-)